MLNHATAVATSLGSEQAASLLPASEQAEPASTWDGIGLLAATAGQPVIAAARDECGRPLTASLLAWAPDVEQQP